MHVWEAGSAHCFAREREAFEDGTTAEKKERVEIVLSIRPAKPFQSRHLSHLSHATLQLGRGTT
jgi:hypothetical protein